MLVSDYLHQVQQRNKWKDLQPNVLIGGLVLVKEDNLPIPVAERSKAWVCSRLPTGIAGSNPAGGMDVCCKCCVFFQVEVSATGRSLVQRSPTDCGASLCVISKLQE